MLLMAAKDVATALTELINSTKNSSGKSATDPAMETLKVSAKVYATYFTICFSITEGIKIIRIILFLDNGNQCIVASQDCS